VIQENPVYPVILSEEIRPEQLEQQRRHRRSGKAGVSARECERGNISQRREDAKNEGENRGRDALGTAPPWRGGITKWENWLLRK